MMKSFGQLGGAFNIMFWGTIVALFGAAGSRNAGVITFLFVEVIVICLAIASERKRRENVKRQREAVESMVWNSPTYKYRKPKVDPEAQKKVENNNNDIDDTIKKQIALASKQLREARIRFEEEIDRVNGK